jgi:hypothetical protein
MSGIAGLCRRDNNNKFASTVDSVRFQEEGVVLMLRRETVPESLQLQVDGQTQSLQVGCWRAPLAHA